VILAIQDLLTNPNPDSPAQREAFEIFTTNPVEYRKRIREQTRRNLPQS
jgi:ubiquitin-conjugating enzyme E2 I